MKYTVVWQPPAEAKLADLWAAATDRHAVADAADRIDAVLSRDPDSKGESRTGNTRVLIVRPLGVRFVVSEADRTARVFAVWRTSS
ncbi:MAG: hypothetical protein HYS13_16665 [Planctomycetia bacterium]|nr:hypothetical protein [Planctomycetia bacterium]